MNLSRYLSFTRDEWAPLRGKTPLTLNESELRALRGLNERLDLDEVRDIYLPLSRLLNLYVAASQQLGVVTDTFLGNTAGHVPFIIGLAGSVAVGKSTTARVLQALLARWPDHPRVDLVTTDGFIFPNKVLLERKIMDRKGFPESYDVKRINPIRHTIELPIDEIILNNSENLQVPHSHDDHNLAQSIDTASDAVFGYLAFPFTQSTNGECKWVLNPKFNTNIVVTMLTLK